MKFPRVCLLSLAALTPAAGTEAAPISLAYTLPRASQVSLLIQNDSGQVVRELLHAAPRPAGATAEPWDGLDEKGQPVPVGRYTWKLLATQGLTAEYLFSLGTNNLPKWSRWVGNHWGVSAIALDRNGNAYFAAGNGEGTPALVKQSIDNQTRHWEIPHWLDTWTGVLSVEVVGDTVWLFDKRGFVWQARAEDGVLLTLRKDKWDVSPTTLTEKLDAPRDKLDPEMRGQWMAAGPGQIVIANFAQNAVRWYDPQTQELRHEMAIARPLGIALTPEGRTLAISQDQVWELSPETRTSKVLINENLRGAYRLAVDPLQGDLFVAERGAGKQPTGQQVKRFNAQGKFLRAYGKDGGRDFSGAYDPLAFTTLADIKADGRGGFVIVEDYAAPRRAAHFDKDGNLLHEWYGGQMYANFAAADPADPTQIWMDSTFHSLIHAKADYAEKSWKVVATYRMDELARGFYGTLRHGGFRWVPRRHEGKLYLARSGGYPAVLRVDEDNHRLIPLVASGSGMGQSWKSQPEFIKEILGLKAAPLAKGKNATWLADKKVLQGKDSWFWTDANGDGEPQAGEVAFYPELPFNRLGGWSVDLDLNFYCLGQIRDADGKSRGAQIQRFVVREWSPEGIPRYAPWNQMEGLTRPGISAGGVGAATARDATGNFFVSTNQNAKTKNFGTGFWAARANANWVYKFDKEGNLQWRVGRHAPGSAARPGEGKFFWRITGTPHGGVAVGDVEGSYTHVWDPDGLWVGRLLDNPDRQAAPEAAYRLDVENFGGSLYSDPKTGEVLYFGGSCYSSPVYRITGWDQFQRQSGQIEVTPAVAGRIQAEDLAQRERDDLATIPYLRGEVATDGTLKKWEKFKPNVILDGDKEVARFWMGVSQGNLLATFDVTTDTPFKNSAPPELGFQGGASLALNFAAWEPGKKQPARGDFRLVYSPKTGVRIFIPKQPEGKRISRNAPVYETGNGRQLIEGFVAPPGPAKVVPKPDGTGYIVDFQVPQSYLPLEIIPGKQFHFDATVALADPEGNKTIARIPWHSRDANDMATDDVFVESVLRPHNWGEARVVMD